MSNASPFKRLNLFFYGWCLSGLMQKNLEYQGLTNVLWYFTLFYGSHLWQDQGDINCHTAKWCHHTNGRKSRGVSKKGHKGKAMEGNGRDAGSGVGSYQHQLWEWNFNPGQLKKQKCKRMSSEIVITSRACFQVNVMYFRGFGEQWVIAGPMLVYILLEMLFLTLSGCLGCILDCREFLKVTRLGITSIV